MLPLVQNGAEEDRAIASTCDALEAALGDRARTEFSAKSRAQNQWTLPVDEQRFLANLIAHLKPQHILEFGSGTSTHVLARAVAQLDTPCCITSVEHDPDFRRT